MKLRMAVLAAAAMAALPVGSMAAEGRLSVELNKLETREDSCRAYVVLQNGTGQKYSSLKLDLVMFDAGGVVAERLALETAPLPAGKTSLKVFDIAGLACEGIGRILVNDVLTCEADADAGDCLEIIDVSAREGLSLIK